MVIAQDLSYRNSNGAPSSRGGGGAYITVDHQPSNPRDPYIPTQKYNEVAKHFAPIVFLADHKYRPGNASTWFSKCIITCCNLEGDAHFAQYESSTLDKVRQSWPKWNVGAGSKNGAGGSQDAFYLYPGKDGDMAHAYSYLGGDAFKRDDRNALYTDSKAYYHVLETGPNVINIQYWLFYPNNGNGKLGTFKTEVGAHEADWELIVLKIENPLDYNKRRISGMWLSQHGNAEPVYENAIVYSGSHPIVYSAENSHANYNRVGRNTPSEKGWAAIGRNIGLLPADWTAKGPKWETWENLTDMGSLTRPTRGNEWLWFNGRWGKTDSNSKSPSGPAFQSDWFKKY
jgi:hypothetical protein